MPKLTDDEIDIIECAIWDISLDMQSTSSSNVRVSAHDGESQRSIVEFRCGNSSIDSKNADIFGEHMRKHYTGAVLLIPVGSRDYIVSNDLLRKVFCQ